MDLNSITFSQVATAAGVFLAIISAAVVVMNFFKLRREEIKIKNEPFVKLSQRVDSHEAWLASDKQRIEALEQHNREQDQLSNIIVRSQLAMLRQMQTGENKNGLKESETEITDFLTKKGTK